MAAGRGTLVRKRGLAKDVGVERCDLKKTCIRRRSKLQEKYVELKKIRNILRTRIIQRFTAQ